MALTEQEVAELQFGDLLYGAYSGDTPVMVLGIVTHEFSVDYFEIGDPDGAVFTEGRVLISYLDEWNEWPVGSVDAWTPEHLRKTKEA